MGMTSDNRHDQPSKTQPCTSKRRGWGHHGNCEQHLQVKEVGFRTRSTIVGSLESPSRGEQTPCWRMAHYQLLPLGLPCSFRGKVRGRSFWDRRIWIPIDYPISVTTRVPPPPSPFPFSMAGYATRNLDHPVVQCSPLFSSGRQWAPKFQLLVYFIAYAMISFPWQRSSIHSSPSLHPTNT